MKTWRELEEECYACHKCDLAENRHHVVIGTGNKTSDVMLIGEGPGENEDLQGEPFVGAAGRLLDEMLSIIDLSRDRNIYIANIVKCRPPHNRDPQDTEQESCFPYLEEQIGLVSPKIIVCLGRIAACRLIRNDFRITKEHGKWYDYKGTLITAIYHPSALLRDLNKRPETFEDLKSIQRKIKEVCPDVYSK